MNVAVGDGRPSTGDVAVPPPHDQPKPPLERALAKRKGAVISELASTVLRVIRRVDGANPASPAAEDLAVAPAIRSGSALHD